MDDNNGDDHTCDEANDGNDNDDTDGMATVCQSDDKKV